MARRETITSCCSYIQSVTKMSETKAPRPRNVLMGEFEGLSKEDASQALRDSGGDLDDEAARPSQRTPTKAGDTATGKADAPLEISDSDDDAAPAAKRQRTDDAPVDLTLDSGDDEAARPGLAGHGRVADGARVLARNSEEGDDNAPPPQRGGPAPLSQFFAPQGRAARGTKPPGLLRLGVRRGGGPDPGTRS